MDKMIATDGKQVSVTAEYHDVKLGVGQFHPCSEGDSPPMGGMIGV